MESEGGSRIDYRLPNALITVTPDATGFFYDEVAIPV